MFSRTKSNTDFAEGSCWISAIRLALSGMTLTRASRLNVCGSTRSAVPAQLLETTSTSRWALGAARAGGARAARAAAIRSRASRRIAPQLTETTPFIELAPVAFLAQDQLVGQRHPHGRRRVGHDRHRLGHAARDRVARAVGLDHDLV